MIQSSGLDQSSLKYPRCIQSETTHYLKRRYGDPHPDNIVCLPRQPTMEAHYPFLNHNDSRIPLMGSLFLPGTAHIYFDGIPTDIIEVEDTPIARKADFVMGVDGRRIEPDFYDGDKVFVKKCICLNIDDIEIFLKGSDCYIKKLREE